ncbi:MAG: pentapeptide repeat-containing protein, partial [Ktedonobacteraceae bacterium]
HTPRQQPDHWQPPMLRRANLRGRDLSHRYIGHADLREAQLMGANLYMTDLTAASLAGANLEGANLAGTNLGGADLRGANLRGANLLVADLHNTLLHGAILQDVRGLVLQQLQEASYDSTTIIDRAIYTALAPTPDAQCTQPELPQTSSKPLPDPDGISEPAENEITLRMPVPGQGVYQKTTTDATGADSSDKHSQMLGQSMRAEAPAPVNVQMHTARPGTTYTPEQHRESEKVEDESEEIDEVPSNKIIRLSSRPAKADPSVGTKRTDDKTQGDNRICTISGISRKQG